MTRSASGLAAAILFIALAVPALGQNYFLYTPKPATVEERKQAKDSILVREVTVQKGDTLSALSRTYSGRSSYYPQILLFNNIRNPHLIHIGDNIKVPVTRDESAETKKKSAASAPKMASSAPRKQEAANPAVTQPVSELSLNDLKQTGTSIEKKKARREPRKASVREGKKRNTAEPALTAAQATKNSASGNALYEQAKAAYQKGDCTTALPLLDRFIADNPSSPQAAEASLSKADCYLKLSR